jgi:hypothetical protein
MFKRKEETFKHYAKRMDYYQDSFAGRRKLLDKEYILQLEKCILHNYKRGFTRQYDLLKQQHYEEFLSVLE